MLAPLLLCAALAAVPPAPDAGAAGADVKTGKAATVTLVAARMLEYAAAAAAGAPGGMRVVLLVERVPGATGPLVYDVGDFLVRGRSYTETSERRLGRRFAPAVAVEDAAKSAHLGKDLKARFAREGEASVLAITWFGSALPLRGSAEVSLKAGFGGKANPFAFTFELPGK